MSVQSVNQGLNARFVQVAQVRCSLPWLLTHHKCLGGDEPEGVNDDFAFDRLNGINDYGDGTRGKLLEGLLCVDVD